MDSVGKGEGGEIWENGIETCKISCMKRKKKKKRNVKGILSKILKHFGGQESQSRDYYTTGIYR